MAADRGEDRERRKSNMETPDRAPTPGTREHFLEVTRLQRWGTIQEYVELCRARGYFTPEFYRKATAHMERIHVRRMLRAKSRTSRFAALAPV
jgi:hypothetical protein